MEVGAAVNAHVSLGRGTPVAGHRWDVLPAVDDAAWLPDSARHPDVSVIVPYWQDQEGLDRLVSALCAQDYPASRMELLVVDDGSPIPPVPPSDLPFRSRVLRQEDLGFRASAARALGAEHSDGQVLTFLDGDMMPEPDYLSAAAQHPAVSSESVVVGRRRHLSPELLHTGWRSGESVPDHALLPEPSWLTDAYRNTRNLMRADSTAYRFVISAVLTVSREIYNDAGGFDPAFVGYGGEDWELAHRLWRVGGLLEHQPQAVAWQAEADFAGREDPEAARRIKNREAMVLAPRISAPTARGFSLGLDLSSRGSVPGDTVADPPAERSVGIVQPHHVRGPRVGIFLPYDPGQEAATILSVDAMLQTWPSAQLTVGARGASQIPEEMRGCMSDPRITVSESSVVSAEQPIPDWSVELHQPCRPLGAGVRPEARAASSWLLKLEAAGIDRVAVVEGKRTLATLTSSRANWRRRRWGTSDPTREVQVSAQKLGWEAVDSEPDLEAWWGGWG